MFVTEIFIDTGNTERIKLVDNWSQVKALLSSIQGLPDVFVALSNGEELPHMVIGGGSNGHYITYITYDNLSFFNLRDSSLLNSNGEVAITIGGQEADYQIHECVSLDISIRAAKLFVLSGEVDQSFVWQQS